MKTKFLLATGVGALAAAGAYGVSINEGAAPAPFVNPLSLASSICGDGAAGANRRAYFMRIGAAYAKDTGDRPVAGAPLAAGAIAYPVSTKVAAAQAHFNAGVAHAWNFNHGAAAASFKAAQDADPACAMCYWGEAFSLGPNINAPMDDAAIPAAYAAAKKAKALSAAASEKERALIDALALRYAAKPVKDRARLDAAFADAMDKAARAYPDDPFVLSLAAEANMDTQPWNYWEADRRTAKGRAARTIELIEAALAIDPDYIPAIHLYIHMTENTHNPYRAEPYADKLAALSAGLGHLIHMPAHTYYRIGRFKDSLDHNVVAVEADEAFLAANAASPLYEYGYYVHNIHFVMTSAMMAGDAGAALDMAQKLDAKLPADMAAAVPFSQPIKASPYFAYALFGEPDAVLALPDPGPSLPLIQGLWRYARGEAFARRGDARSARAEAQAIAALIESADFTALETQMVGIPATDILKIARLTVGARAAVLEGDKGAALAKMEEAVAIQESLPYTEPPYWHYPAKQTLAAIALEAGQVERAEQLFIETLAQSPNNGWALFGLAETYRRQGDKNAAKYANALFKSAWAGDRKALTLAAL